MVHRHYRGGPAGVGAALNALYGHNNLYGDFVKGEVGDLQFLEDGMVAYSAKDVHPYENTIILEYDHDSETLALVPELPSTSFDGWESVPSLCVTCIFPRESEYPELRRSILFSE